MIGRLLRIVGLASAVVLVLAVGQSWAAFGLHAPDATYTTSTGEPVRQAGSHPYDFTTDIEVNTRPTPEGEFPDGEVKDIQVDLPRGLVGTPDPVPTCPPALFAAMSADANSCPADSVVGTTKILGGFGAKAGTPSDGKVVNLEASPGTASKIGFKLLTELVTIETTLSQTAPYHLEAHVTNIPNAAFLYSARLTLWGVPASPAHDSERGLCGKLSCPVNLPEKPFLTMPRSCSGPLFTTFAADSWEQPGLWTQPIAVPTHDNAEPPNPIGLEGCERLEFKPTMAVKPTTGAADSPSGIDANLDVADPGLTEADGIAGSDIRKVVVTLPKGMTTNPSVAAGLEACSLSQYRSERLDSRSGTGCPQGSKIGTVEVETPLLEDTVLHGSIFVAKQHDNTFDNLLTIYMVIKDPKLGIMIKQAGRVDPDPATGQLTTTFDELPEVPFSHFRLHFREGQRAPLITPSVCGEYQTKIQFYPWNSDSPVREETSSFTVDHGAGGGACAAGEGALPNQPGFSAGTTDASAGRYAPFVLKVSRDDGSQHLSTVGATLPEGLLGRLAGIPYCPDGAIAAAQARSGEGDGALEQRSPSCPAASEVGTVVATAGAGSEPLGVTGHAYLAGPYRGAPISLVIVTPAIAGPFDLGVVAVRTALRVDPLTAQVSATSDPIPTILHGLPLDLRSIAVVLGRPDFTLNPTSCEPKAILGSIASTTGAIASPSQYFQATGCRSLKFKPKLKIQLKGATKRTGHPSLRAVLTMRPGEAGIGRAQVNLPHGEFLDQGNIDRACTRPVLLAGNCPKSSIYGRAKAWSPLLAEPLQGPVYLVGGFGYKLPALVAELNGQIRVLLVGKVDSGKNKGIRNTFEVVPDAPVSRFVLTMKGGKKYGLLENSENLCKAKKAKRRAIVRFRGQNGKVDQYKPVVANQCGKKKHKKHKGHGGTRSKSHHKQKARK